MTRHASFDADRLQTVVDGIVDEIGQAEEWGATSRQLPELEKVDTRQFGIAVVDCHGAEVTGGDADTRFSIQSISKVFSLWLALDAFGDEVWKRVGREPSGDPFNSIIDLERMDGIPRNPFINAGALVVVDMLLDQRKGDGVPDDVRELLETLIGDDDIGVDADVVRSSSSSGYINRALANLAKSFGNFNNEVEDVMAAYVRQCAIALSARQLARAGCRLMIESEGGGTSLEEARRARRIAAVMLTCGPYDGAGDFAFRVGLPAKSGIGGGILAIVPNVASVAVWSPGLDDKGNSLLGTLALERLSEQMDWSVFGAVRR